MAKNKEINKQDLIKYIREFYTTSWAWRSQAYHNRWNEWQNNYHSIYPERIKQRKEAWQSILFVPETFKVIEVICAALTKTILGKAHPIAFDPRERGDELQAELNTDLLSYELDRSNFVTAFYDVMKEALIYGSGFMKLYWLKKKDKRRIQVPNERYGLMESIQSGFKYKAGSAKNYKEEIQDIYVKENVVAERVHIRDIFLEPNSTDLQRVLHRTKITFGELLDLAKQGFIEKEGVEELRDVIEAADFEANLGATHQDGRDLQERRYADDAVNAPGDVTGLTAPTPVRTKFDQAHSIWEFWGPVPRRFVELELDPESDAGNEMVPGKLLVASGGIFLGSEENPNQSMQPPFLQCDYIRTGATYGKGCAQIMEGLQEDLNETTNQRIDNVSLIMNKMFAILERGVVNPDELISAPGGVIRLNGNLGETDINKVIMPLQFPDITMSAYRETQERERQIQEATAANRVTVGTAGQVNDQNQTLGGMELLKQAAADRFTTYAYIMGRQFLIPAAQKYIELIYQNAPDERIARILGDQPVEILPGEVIKRHMAFKKQPPHELCQDYDLVPVDVFNEENKQIKKMQLANDLQLTAGILPEFNPYPGLKRLYHYDGFENDEILEILGENQGMIKTPLAQGIGQPSISAPNSGASSASGTPPPAVQGPGF